MKKLKLILTLLLVAAGVNTTLAQSQSYPTNYTSSQTSDHATRYPSKVTITRSDNSTAEVAWASANHHSLYMDKTESSVIEVTAGEQFNIAMTVGDGGWMSFYVYIDYGKDGQFSYTVDEDNHRAAAGSDLVAFSFYTFNPEVTEDPGWNSAGTRLSGDTDRNTVAIPHTIAAPTKPGDYRIRVKWDWNSIDPAGSITGHKGGSMQANGGGIMDFTLRVIPKFVYTDELNNTFTINVSNWSSITNLKDEAKRLINENCRDYYDVESVSPSEIDENAMTYNVKVHNTFPFKVCTGYSADADGWYLLNCPTQYREGALYMPTRYDYTEDGEEVKSDALSRQLSENYLWCFVKVNNTQNHFKVYNMAKGDNAMRISSDDVATFSSTATEQEFIVKKATMDGVDYFIMQDPARANAHLGRHKGTWNDNNIPGSNEKLGFWAPTGNAGNSATDAGSMLNVTPVDQLCDFGMAPNYSAEKGYVGAYTEHADEFNSTYKEYKDNGTTNALKTLIATTVPPRLEISENKYYQIISYNNGKTIYANPYIRIEGSTTGDANGEFGMLLDTNADVAKSAVQFVLDGENYDIKHANSEFWFVDLNVPDQNAQTDLITSQPGTGSDYFLFNEGGMVNVWSLHCTTSPEKYLSADNDQVKCGAKPSENPNALWLIKELTEIPVSVSAAGWATLCLPMAVVVPQDCNVYYASGKEGNVLTLTKIPAGKKIPAETAVLIEGNPDNYNFKMPTGTEEEYTVTDNQLSGSTARRTGLPVDGFYALSAYTENNENKVGFLLSGTVTSVPANKAYILNPTEGGSQGISRFTFAIGNETGIATHAESEKTLYFDLNGRAVAFPTTGIYTTSDGKKVFIK